MEHLQQEAITLLGLSLKTKTTNENGQSGTDCGNLWQQFENETYATKIPNKLSDEIIAVYHEYEGDHTQPFSYFIGCKVAPGTAIPEGMDRLTIPRGKYRQIISKGTMPYCVMDSWKEIWDSNHARTYQTDFEVYDERSKDWSDATVTIFVSVQ